MRGQCLSNLQAQLFGYFPAVLRKRFAADIAGHPLAINVARTMLVTGVVGDAGVSWLAEMTMTAGATAPEILRAYFEAYDLLGARDLKDCVDALAGRIAVVRKYPMRLAIEDAVEAVCLWLLQPPGSAPGRRRRLGLASRGRLGVLAAVAEILDVPHLSNVHSAPAPRTAAAYQAVAQGTCGRALLRHALEAHNSADELERPARLALRGRLRAELLALAAAVLRHEPDMAALSAPTQTWTDALGRELAPLDEGERPLSAPAIAVERIARRAASVA